MAYSQDLENIIEAALVDGVITEKERAVIHKKAQQEGVDPDEVDVIIDGRLAKIAQTPPRQVRRGNVAECPSCGAPYRPGMGKCPECGHVYQNVEANHSAQRLADGIAEITNRFRDKIASASNEEKKEEGVFGIMGVHTSSDSAKLEIQRDDEIKVFITNFVIPSSKDDLLEFILSMEAKLKKGYDEFSDEYKVKYDEAFRKARVLFPDDPQFAPLLIAHDEEDASNAKKKKMSGCFWVIGILVFLFFCMLFG